MYEITEGKHTRRREETGGPQFFSAAPVKPNSITGAEASENSRRPPERKSGREIPIKMKHELTQRCLKGFEAYLQEEERSGATREKYLRDLRAFQRFLEDGKTLDKLAVLRYKEWLVQNYAPASVNSMLAALNSFFAFAGWGECRIKPLRLQRRMFRDPERELTREEYGRLVAAVERRGDERLCLLLQAVCSTGIRVSELEYITVEAARLGRAEVACKGKRRTVFLPRQLSRRLMEYARRMGVKKGPLFLSRNGLPLGRSYIWALMKSLCAEAGVEKSKVFPHNLRHLFARVFYSAERNLVRLADLLGHSNINTTRIYTMESGEEQEKRLDRLGLVLRCSAT